MKRLSWWLWCSSFWTILFEVVYSGIYFIAKESKFVEFIGVTAVITVIGSLLFATVLFPQSGSITKKGFLWESVLFWMLYSHLVWPIFLGYNWWVTGKTCSCDGSFLCFCPPDSLIKAIMFMYSLIWGYSPLVGLGLSLITLVVMIVGSMIFRGIILRYSK